jgi:SAM-dependent methyltransferase
VASLPGPWQLTYDAANPAELAQAYELWAPSYDADSVDAFGYAGPRAAAELLCRHAPQQQQGGTKDSDCLTVLDAGVGTGLVGQELFSVASSDLAQRLVLHGADTSEDMLSQAAKKMQPVCVGDVGGGGIGIYTALHTADLNKLSSSLQPSGLRFDVVVCVGTLTPKHCGPQALDELVRVVRPGGLLVFTLRTDFYEDAAAGMGARLRELDNGAVVTLGEEEPGLALRLLERTEPELYTPLVSDDILFSAWAYKVLAAA